MKIKIIIAAATLTATIASSAQQVERFSQFTLIPQTINPAMIGLTDGLNISAVSRIGLVGIPGGPITNGLYFDGPIPKKHMALGLGLNYSRTGLSNRLRATGMFGYNVWLSDQARLLFGISFGVVQNSIDESNAVVLDETDPFLVAARDGRLTADANAGIALRLQDLTAGFSAFNLMESSIRFNREVDINYALRRQYYGHLSYRFFLNDKHEWSVNPILLGTLSKNSVLPQEASVHFNWKDVLWFGAGYRGGGGFTMTFGLRLQPDVRLGYGMDIAGKVPTAGTSHEFALTYVVPNVAGQLRDQQRQIDELLEELVVFEDDQARRDSLQDIINRQQQEDIDSLTEELRKEREYTKTEFDSVNNRIERTRADLDSLEAKLIRQGVFKPARVGDYRNWDGTPAVKGYYMVIASVKNRVYRPEAMKREYLDKGYKVIYDEKRGWYYAYTEKPETFEEALKQLKQLRSGEHPTAWIRILR